jgi:FkbM family methyltransferase
MDFRREYETAFDTIEEIKNPLINENKSIKWPSQKLEFMKRNNPNYFEYDVNIKMDIVEKALSIPLNNGIIDSGAHIGDGTVPIAHALINMGRDDIIIYAIDPSKYKCDFLKKIADINNLHNIKVICAGLGNENNEYMYDANEERMCSTNSGGWSWRKNTEDSEGIEVVKFYKLDYLMSSKSKDKQINCPIKIIHLDVQDMEEDVLRGSTKTIKKYKPYLSLEDAVSSTAGKLREGKAVGNPVKCNDYLKLLPTGYKFMERIDINDTFEYIGDN